MTKIKILVERSAGSYRASARDEFGVICSSSHNNKAAAIERVKVMVPTFVDGELDFEVAEMNLAETPE